MPSFNAKKEVLLQTNICSWLIWQVDNYFISCEHVQLLTFSVLAETNASSCTVLSNLHVPAHFECLISEVETSISVNLRTENSYCSPCFITFSVLSEIDARWWKQYFPCLPAHYKKLMLHVKKTLTYIIEHFCYLFQAWWRPVPTTVQYLPAYQQTWNVWRQIRKNSILVRHILHVACSTYFCNIMILETVVIPQHIKRFTCASEKTYIHSRLWHCKLIRTNAVKFRPERGKFKDVSVWYSSVAYFHAVSIAM